MSTAFAVGQLAKTTLNSFRPFISSGNFLFGETRSRIPFACHFSGDPYYEMASSQSDASVLTTVLRPGDEDPGACSSAGHAYMRLLQQEVTVLNIFRETAQAFARGDLQIPSEPKKRLEVEVRVAGGWVRDKLLGIESDDMDITMDCLTGVEFATLVQQYLQGHTELVEGKKIPKVGVIAANPAQSKHLETATMKVCGIEIDFCNLRKNETYTEDSRIPTTEFGSPADDAQRRDFCLNALFFNLQSNQVEDWSKKGMDDLFGTPPSIRTPLPPLLTFQDDPLRILRAIRFAVRLGATLAPELKEASLSPAIHDRLCHKVSRERFGKELEGMLSGKGAKPAKALATIAQLDLGPVVFEGSGREIVWSVEESVKNLEKLETVLGQFDSMEKPAGATPVERRLLHLACLLYPHRHLRYTDRKSKQVLQVEYMMRESIKFKNKDVSGMITLMDQVDEGRRLFPLLVSSAADRLGVGLWVRSCREMWVTCLLLAAAMAGDGGSALEQAFSSVVHIYKLDMCWKTPPLMNGKDLIEELKLPRGPVVGLYVEEQVRWMLIHPDGKKDELMAHLKEYDPPPTDHHDKKPRVKR